MATQVKEGKRDLGRTQREMSREQQKLASEARNIEAKIKELIRGGRQNEARMLAKQLVHNREAQSKLSITAAHLGGMGYQMTNMQMQAKVSSVLGDAGEMMAKVNAGNGTKSVIENVRMYEKEGAKMEMTQEMMDDTLESVLGGSEIDSAADDVLAEVLDGVSMEVGNRFGIAPTHAPGITKASGTGTETAAHDELADLMKRLERL